MIQQGGSATAVARQIAEEETLRAAFYGLLSRLLSRAPDAADLNGLAGLAGDDTPLGAGIAALARVARNTTPAAAEREFNTLFIGLGRGELLPYASYYLTGFLNEKPLATLRSHMAKLGIARDADTKEPEDHIATLCEIMAGLIEGRHHAEPLALADQEAFFNTHIAVWAGHFFGDLEAAGAAVLYAPVGTIGRAFMDIEIEAFRMEH